MQKSRGSIAKALFNTCLTVDRDITRLPDKEARLWAKSNALRHALTVKAILNNSDRKKKEGLKILNASGINCGHQDFSIMEYLKNHFEEHVDWTVFDSPNNKYLKEEKFQEMLESSGIDLQLSDFKNADTLYGNNDSKYDVILFTEIAEHLEHSTFLKCLKVMRSKLSDNGVIVITTPNMLSLANRMRFLFGRGDRMYYGEGNKNLDFGLFGHIVLYDLYRLKKLLRDSGFKPLEGYTFDDNHGADKKKLGKKILVSLLELFAHFVKNSKKRLIIVAQKDEPVYIDLNT